MAEMQAYYAAEAGMQSTLNVLGNVAPIAAMPGGTKINFRNAITPSMLKCAKRHQHNPATFGWLDYSYTPTG